MRYAQIRDMDISNGEKIGVALFTSGCRFYCKNCFNKELWDVKSGNLWSKEVEDNFLTLAKPDYISRISILGGEPFIDENLTDLEKLVKRIKETYPNKKLWIYSGYTYEELKDFSDYKIKYILHTIDYLIDGPYIDDLRDITLPMRGSSNQ